MRNALSSRRCFLKRSAGLAGGAIAVASVAAPHVWVSRYALAGQPPSERLGVGCIGVGGRGSGIGNQACQLGVKIACADVDRNHAERFAGKDRCEVYTDYRKLLERKDIDVVTIGTPDHWHTKIAIEAMLAGKDVYCEKPLTLTIDEGKLICRVVKQTKRVFQVGTQQRSDRRFLTAVALARSGRLGKVLKATCSIGAGPSSQEFPTSEPPPGLDWDFWLGQCPKLPYTPQRCHGNFRWWLEYSGGKITDWGAHHVDIAQWAIGCEHTGPVEIEGKGEFPVIPEKFDPVAFFAGKFKLPNAYNTATQFHVDLRFANGSTIHVQHAPDNGIWLEGDQGKIFVNRGRITGKPVEEMTEADRKWLEEEIRKLYKDKEPTGHMANFFACVKDRSEPVSDVFSHHREVSSCHLCNIAMLLRRKLRWDPAKEDFIGDQQASALVARPQRRPYEIKI